MNNNQQQQNTNYVTKEEVRRMIAEAIGNINQDVQLQQGRIQSANFKSGVQGWQLKANGASEFN